MTRLRARVASRTWRELAVLVLFALCSVAAFRCTVFGNGVPSYRHDWSWSDLREAQIAPMGYLLGVWNPNGLGQPNVRVVDHPALWLRYGLGFVLDPKAALLVFVLGSTFFFAWGTYRFVRRLDVPPALAVAAAIVATFGPATFDKFVAGHWYYLVAAAAIPWAFLSALDVGRTPTWASALRTGAIVALTSLQPQLWAFTQPVAIALALAGGRLRARIGVAAVVALTGAVLMVPSMAGALGAHSGGFLAGEQTMRDWELNNSAALGAAPIALGYFAIYAEIAFAAAGALSGTLVLLWLIPLGAVAGIVAGWRLPAVRIVGAGWIVALLIVLGLHGPLGGALAWLFDRYVWFSTFRELYHFALPMWLCACLLAAWSVRTLRRPWQAAAIAASLLPVAVLWWAPNYGGQLFSFPQSPSVREALSALARTPGNDRFALLPAINPVGPVGRDDVNGLDPYANPIGNHPTANVQEIGGTLAAVLLMAQRRDPSARAWLDAAGIGTTVELDGIRSRPSAIAPLAATLQRRLHDAEASRLPAGAAVGSQRSAVAFAATAVDVVTDPFGQPFRGGFILSRDAGDRSWESFASPAIDSQRLNPFDGWVKARYWYWLDPRAAFWPDAAITLSEQPLPVPAAYRNGWMLAFASSGFMVLDGKAVPIPARQNAWIPLSSRVATVHVARGLGMVLGFARQRPMSALTAPRPVRWTVPFSYACMCAAGELPSRARWLVLKQSFDAGWNLRLDGAKTVRHLVYSGYGNAWQIEPATSGTMRYALEYLPARWWQPLVGASLDAWLVLTIGAIALRIIPRHRRHV